MAIWTSTLPHFITQLLDAENSPACTISMGIHKNNDSSIFKKVMSNDDYRGYSTPVTPTEKKGVNQVSAVATELN